jgi:hypothetical protein
MAVPELEEHANNLLYIGFYKPAGCQCFKADKQKRALCDEDDRTDIDTF